MNPFQTNLDKLERDIELCLRATRENTTQRGRQMAWSLLSKTREQYISVQRCMLLEKERMEMSEAYIRHALGDDTRFDATVEDCNNILQQFVKNAEMLSEAQAISTVQKKIFDIGTTAVLNPLAPAFIPGDDCISLPPVYSEMHGGVISMPRIPVTVNVPALENLSQTLGGGLSLTNNTNHRVGSALTLNHNVNLTPETKSYFASVGEQAIRTGVHLTMHKSLKGIMFTVLEFLYVVMSPLLPNFTVASLMTDYLWPLIERFTTYLASKVRKCETPTPAGAIQTEQHSLAEHNWMEMLPLGAGLASIVASLIVGKQLTASAEGLREYKKWTDYGAGLSKIKSAITTVTEFTSWVIEHTRSLMLSYFPDASVSSSLQQQFSLHKIDISQYMRDVAAMVNPTNADAVLRDERTPSKLEELVNLSSRILILDGSNKVAIGASTRQALSVLRRDLTTFAQSFSSCRAAEAKRPTPYHISLYGQSGVGKSDIVNSLIYDLTDPEWFKHDVQRAENGRVTVYPRSASDPYWSNYAGQTAVILDDFGQSGQDTVADSEYLSLIFMVSGVTYMPRMAAVADKGRHFTSRLIVSTTNSMFPTSLCVKTNEALWRRRNDLVEVTALNHNIDDPERFRFNLLDPCPINKNNHSAIPEQRYIRRNLTYIDLMKYLIPRFNAFCERDARAVNVKTAMTPEQHSSLRAHFSVAPVLPPPIVPTPAPEGEMFVQSGPIFRPSPSVTAPIAFEHEAVVNEVFTEAANAAAPLVSLMHCKGERIQYTLEREYYSLNPEILRECNCCGEVQQNPAASICCAPSDYWHPIYAGVPSSATECPLVLGCCALYNSSPLSAKFFERKAKEASDYHLYAFLQAVQVQALTIPRPNGFNSGLDIVFPESLNNYIRDFHRLTNQEFLQDYEHFPRKPIQLKWKDVRKAWNIFFALKKYGFLNYFANYICPSDRFLNELDNAVIVTEQHSGEHTIACCTNADGIYTETCQNPDHRKTNFSDAMIYRIEFLMARANLDLVQRCKIWTLSEEDCASVLTNQAAVMNQQVLALQLIAIWDVRNTNKITATQHAEEALMTQPELIENGHEQYRLQQWWEKAPATLKVIMKGLGLAAAALTTWKVYNWLAKEDVTIEVPTNLGMIEVEASIKKNFNGHLKDVLCATLVGICASAMGGTSSSMEGGSFGYDGRARFLRQGRVLRTAQHALADKTIIEVQKIIDCFTNELKAHLNPGQIAQFRLDAADAIQKVFADDNTVETRMEDSSDLRTQDIIEYKLKQTNGLYASRTRVSGVSAATNGLALRGKFALFPFHLFHDLKKGDTTELTVRTPKTTVTVALEMGVSIRRAESSHSVASRDLALVYLGARVPSFPDVSNHFISEDDLAAMHSTPATVVGIHPRTQMMTQHVSIARRDDQAITYGDEFETYLLPRHWTYTVQSFPGFCGATVACLNTLSSGCIMGMHVSGAKTSDTSYAAIVTKEWLNEQLNSLYPQESEMHFGTLPVDGPLTSGQGEPLLFSECTIEKTQYPTIEPVGQVKTFAYLNSRRAERVSSKTDIVPSPLFDLVEPHQTAPAVLHPNDPRLEIPVSPMNVGAQKYALATKPQNPIFIRRAASFILSTLLCYVPVGIEKRVLTLDEGINGVPAAGFARINPLTSPGLPFKWWKPAFAKGKRFLMNCSTPDDKDPRMTMTIKDKYLDEQVADYHQKLLNGEQTFILSYSNLKDERRSLEKVRTGATRLFDCMPLHYNIECRRFFGAFIACMNQNCTKLPSSVGINVTGSDWTDLYHRLNRFGGNVIAGDYKAWDGKFDPDVLVAACGVINGWYNDGPINARARLILIEQLIHLYTLYGNVVTQKSQGIPSGVPITADINGLGNWFYFLICLQTVASQKGQNVNFDTLHDEMECAFYGDDHLVATSHSIQKWFTFHDVQQYFTQIGMGYTDALKKGGEQPPFEPLLNGATYLKRKFIAHHQYETKMLAPIETKTIYEEINWLRKTPSVEHERDAMYQNLETALLEAYHHGYDFYTCLLRKINSGLSQLREADLFQEGSSSWRDLTTEFAERDALWLEAKA